MPLDQLSQAATLFGLGMGTVFVLLSLLITCVTLLSMACQKFETNPVHAVPNIGVAANARGVGNQTSGQTNISEQEKAVVIAAIQAHRQAKGL